MEVGFQRVGDVGVDNEANVGLVDAHAEGVGGDNDTYSAVHPLVLFAVAGGAVKAGVVVVGRDTVLLQKLGDLFGFSAVANIDDARARVLVHDAQHAVMLVFLFHHVVG